MLEESTLGQENSLNKVMKRNGKHGLYGSEGTCLIIVDILYWTGVLKVTVVCPLLKDLNSSLSLWGSGVE